MKKGFLVQLLLSLFFTQAIFTLVISFPNETMMFESPFFVGTPESVSFDISGFLFPIAFSKDGVSNCTSVDQTLKNFVMH